MLQALADCNEALRLKPLNAGTIANRAFVYLRLGELTRALADYNAALEIDPKSAHALYGRSLAQRQSGDTAAAEADAAAAKLIQSNVEAEFANSGIN
jgi:Tfp pilus assembly protein PilF